MVQATSITLLSLMLSSVTAMPKAEFNKVAIFTPVTARICSLAVVCPMVCSAVSFTGRDFDPSLISLVIATPSAFSINAAYMRRERALQGLADIRATSWSLQQSATHWASAEHAAELEERLRRLYSTFLVYLTNIDERDEERMPERTYDREERVLEPTYEQLQAVFSAVEAIRRNPLPHAEAGADGLATVLCADARQLTTSIEQVRVIATTRTPRSLRGFTVWGSTLFPVIFAPYFAALALESDGVPWPAYLTSILFSFTISALVSIQRALEDPFDGDTVDDIELALFAPSLIPRQTSRPL